MASTLQIFIAVLVLYVAVVNYLVVQSLNPAASAAPRAPERLRTAAVSSPAPAATPAPPACHDDTVYVAVMLPPAAAMRDNAPSSLLATLRRVEHPLLSVHLLLVGDRTSALHTHRQWCSPNAPTLPCSVLEMEDADPRVLFRRVLAQFECVQDLVVLGVNAHATAGFFERLNLAPRDRVTCLGVHPGRCPGFRVSAAYMREHPYATDIAAGALTAGQSFEAQPVLA